MSDILDQLNEAALFATNRACTFDGQPDEAGMRDLGYAYGHLHREAFTEIERLRGALRAIEAFGHGNGHGRGFTCANMAQEALGASDKPGEVLS